MLLPISPILLSDRGNERVRGIGIGKERREGEDDFVERQGGRPSGFEQLRLGGSGSANRIASRSSERLSFWP